MRLGHLEESELDAFVDGALDEDLAAALAAHIDACPRCAARVAATDPLTHPLAALRDPLPSAALAPSGRPERWIGLLQLAAAALLFSLAGLPDLGEGLRSLITRAFSLAGSLWA
jgi:anti-sigma factor RsiW